MEFQIFIKSLEELTPPNELSVQQQALWYDGHGAWKKAHDLIDQLGDPISTRIHAYLHRKEGDAWNADYWYTRAGEKRPNITLEQEWEMLVKRYL